MQAVILLQEMQTAKYIFDVLRRKLPTTEVITQSLVDFSPNRSVVPTGALGSGRKALLLGVLLHSPSHSKLSWHYLPKMETTSVINVFQIHLFLLKLNLYYISKIF